MIQDPASDASKATTPFKSDGNPLILRAVKLIHLSTILEAEFGFGIIPGLIQLALIANSPQFHSQISGKVNDSGFGCLI